MKGHNEFIIPYLGLSDGVHNYHFEIDQSFFQRFEKSNIEGGSFAVEIEFIKQGKMIVLHISCSGHFDAPCDRCLAGIEVPLEVNDKVIIKLTEREEGQEDEVYHMDVKTSHIDLSPFIYESIHLNLPVRNLRDCEREDFHYCDKDVLRRLENTSEDDSSVALENPWEELKKIDFK